MQITINDCQLELVRGDITTQQVAAIVNAANSALAGGGGVDGAIHEAAGPDLKRETDMRYPEGCPTGSAVVSHGHNLAADFVFHAVGPVWTGGREGEEKLLAAAYHRCLELAAENECESIAFPAISTGAYQFPLDLAADISLRTAIEFLEAHGRPRLIRFALFGEIAFNTFQRALADLSG